MKFKLGFIDLFTSILIRAFTTATRIFSSNPQFCLLPRLLWRELTP